MKKADFLAFMYLETKKDFMVIFQFAVFWLEILILRNRDASITYSLGLKRISDCSKDYDFEQGLMSTNKLQPNLPKKSVILQSGIHSHVQGIDNMSITVQNSISFISL